MKLNLLERIKNYRKPYQYKYECFVNGKRVEIKYSRLKNSQISFKKFKFSSGDSALLIETNLLTNQETKFDFLT